ncbi:MAG: arsenate reductase (glutaredoxin) [Alteromonadaceae bacterium]|jgi:arsenate reductase|tara:strand:- start:13679 stop:14017 length:339 start_codon:yes stop_codon:yes gene_type:complete
MLTIYHNPRCSKSRETLQLIQKANKEVTIVEYIKNPLNIEQIKALLSLLNISPIEMMRTKEEEFKALSLKQANDDQLIYAMATHSKLMERPIVTNGSKAVIGRPPENVLTLL